MHGYLSILSLDCPGLSSALLQASKASAAAEARRTKKLSMQGYFRTQECLTRHKFEGKSGSLEWINQLKEPVCSTYGTQEIVAISIACKANQLKIGVTHLKCFKNSNMLS